MIEPSFSWLRLMPPCNIFAASVRLCNSCSVAMLKIVVLIATQTFHFKTWTALFCGEHNTHCKNRNVSWTGVSVYIYHPPHFEFASGYAGRTWTILRYFLWFKRLLRCTLNFFEYSLTKPSQNIFFGICTVSLRGMTDSQYCVSLSRPESFRRRTEKTNDHGKHLYDRVYACSFVRTTSQGDFYLTIKDRQDEMIPYLECIESIRTSMSCN